MGHIRVVRWGILGGFCLAAALWLTVSQLARAQQATIEGWFHILWYDGPPGSGIKGEIYVLIDDQGQEYRLQLDLKLTEPFGGVLALNRKRVKLVVEQTPGPLGQQGSVRVLSIQLGMAGALAGIEPISGPQPWVNLLCKFSDVSAEPQPLSYFTGLMGNTYPGLDHYWREVSYNNINIVGSASQNWKTLPHDRAYYGATGSGTSANLTALFNDCTAIHDADVYFPNFVGINLMFNDLLDCCAWGGSRTATLDGVNKTYRVTWEPPWGYQNQGVMAHEMGHGWGWPHSSGAYGATYDSRWDVMSDIWNTCPPTDPTYGCVGQGTISYHKDLGAWIPSARKFVPTLNTVTTIEIDRLNQPGSSTNYLMARIPIPGSSQFYTVEARRFIGYDGKVPAEAIVIHHVDATRANDAWVVDADGNLDGACVIPADDANCDPDDAGAQWMPGETYTDAANSIQITVNSITATGFIVTITYGNPPSCTNTGAIFRIERTTGNVCADGSFNSGGADVAEYVRVSEAVEPGDVLELDPTKPGHYRKARGAYSHLVAGVVSTQPGVILGARGQSEGKVLLALIGRVPVRATTENGPIRPGDLLTSSSKPGYAMRCESAHKCEGAIIGKALEALDVGEGVILMLLMR
uniref:Uncharacterized protein n=2 Tax=Candidatus Bipolaricaulota TaxID=67810 RepID=H5SG94_9BACT|nr:hypothetical protein HGMM_F23G10C33 [uncultured Acetothermia bacterium]BAL60221.1 hypothetical protein HGMM_OP4C857 [Candidatus Acetothermum autotrophicum]